MDTTTLLEERAIQRQLVAFARAMDNRDWTSIASICTPDICADFGTGEVTGRDTVISFMRSFLDHCGTTQHMLGNFVIDIHGDTANSECYVADMHLSSSGNDDVSFRTLGNYSDSWVKAGGDWKLARRVKDNRAVIGSMDVFKP